MIMKENVEDFPMGEFPVSSTNRALSSSSFPDLVSSELYIPHPTYILPTCSSDESNDNLICMNFELNHYLKEAMNTMYELFQCQKLTDVTLCVNSESIQCHRIVLAGASPYFQAMFTGEMREALLPEIKLHYISSTALKKLIDFAYTGRIQISERNVCELLIAASMIQMSHVVQACCSFLKHQLHPSNAIGIQEFAQSNNCSELSFAAQKFIDQNFSEIVKHDEFLGLHPNQLLSLIKRDELNVRTEAEVYNAVIRWVNHNRNSRLSTLLEALSAVRCYTLPPTFIQGQIKNCNLLAGFTPAKSHLQNILDDLIKHRHISVNKRTAGSIEILYSAGGYLRYSLSAFECYNPVTAKWKRLPDIPSPRSGLSACSVRGCVYLVGGRNNNEQGNIDAPHMDCYDPRKNCWTTCAPMSVPRNRVAVGVVDDMIYAVGGSTNTMHHKSSEKYDPDMDQWTPIASMHSRRIGLGVAVLNRLLYAVGGFDGEKRLNTVERYNPETDNWEELACLNRARSGAGVVALGEYIYAIGGYDSCSQLNTMERYDPKRNCWEYCASMLHPRSALSASVWGSEIWVFGGYDGSEFLASVEVYNPIKDQWTERTFMDCGKSGHAVVVSRGPSF
ncbi:unnamed protein product [Schistosoma turkestanicum]|nr:unnamed protein product [Schistosoma turkestanicum]